MSGTFKVWTVDPDDEPGTQIYDGSAYDHRDACRRACERNHHNDVVNGVGYPRVLLCRRMDVPFAGLEKLEVEREEVPIFSARTLKLKGAT